MALPSLFISNGKQYFYFFANPFSSSDICEELTKIERLSSVEALDSPRFSFPDF